MRSVYQGGEDKAYEDKFCRMRWADVVEVDGCYVGGAVRPENRKEDRKDRRLTENKSDKRRVVIVARERCGRTITTVTKTEADGLAFVESVVSPNTTIHADEAAHWDTAARKIRHEAHQPSRSL